VSFRSADMRSAAIETLKLVAVGDVWMDWFVRAGEATCSATTRRRMTHAKARRPKEPR